MGMVESYQAVEVVCDAKDSAVRFFVGRLHHYTLCEIQSRGLLEVETKSSRWENVITLEFACDESVTVR